MQKARALTTELQGAFVAEWRTIGSLRHVQSRDSFVVSEGLCWKNVSLGMLVHNVHLLVNKKKRVQYKRASLFLCSARLKKVRYCSGACFSRHLWRLQERRMAVVFHAGACTTRDKLHMRNWHTCDIATYTSATDVLGNDCSLYGIPQ